MKKRKQVYTMGVIYVKEKEQEVQQRTEVCRPLRGRFSQGSDRSLPAGGGNGAQTEGEGAEITPCPRR